MNFQVALLTLPNNKCQYRMSNTALIGKTLNCLSDRVFI